MSKRNGTAAIALATCLLVGAVRADEITLFEPGVRGAGTKVLHFPYDQCVGNLYVPPESVSTWDQKRVCPHNWEHVGAARGDVTVPGDRAVQLTVWLRPRPGDLVGLSAQDRRVHQMGVANRARVDPEDLSGLSALGPDDLFWLRVYPLVPRRDADRLVLEPIRRLTGLQMLTLESTGVTPKGMEHLRALRSLRGVVLSRERSIGNAGLAILKDLPALEYLDLDTGVTDAGLKQVAQAGSIRWLRIRTGGFWGPGLAELAKMPRLERLCIHGTTPISDRHLQYLEPLTHLKSLTLWGVADPLTDASLASIGKLRSLEELHFIITSPRFTPAGIAQLKDLKKLRKVDFSGAWVVPESVGYGDEAMRQLAAVLPDLESLEGAGILSAEGVKALATFRNLRVADFTLKDRRQGYHGPTGFSHLSKLRSLEELRVNGETALSDADLACIESLVHLKVFLLGTTEVTDRGLASISKLKQLEQLWLFDARVTHSGLNQLNNLAHLQVLSVGIRLAVQPRTGIDELTLDLSGLQNLKNLFWAGLSLQDADMAFLANLRHLEWVSISAPSLPPSSLRHLSGLSELERLSVCGLARPTDQDLAPLANLANVKDLTLDGKIPDTALSALGGPVGLQTLTVHTSDPIRNQTVAELKQRLPTIEYIRIMEPLPQPTVASQRPRVSQPRK
jgi:hypothetical protein